MKPKKSQSAILDQLSPNDFCQTPAYALEPLLPYLSVDKRLTIWEPAAGEGYLAGALRDSGRTVADSDILSGHNFFSYQPPQWDVLVTNPPYSIKFHWLARCYELGKPFALLVPVQTIGAGAKAHPLFERYGFEMMLLDHRVNFKMPNAGWSGSGAQFPVLWLCWKLLPSQVVLGKIKPTKAQKPIQIQRQLSSQIVQRSLFESV